MKIIRAGKTPRDLQNGCTATCTVCKVKIEIEGTDTLIHTYDQRDGENWSIECPTINCCNKIYIDKRLDVNDRWDV